MSVDPTSCPQPGSHFLLHYEPLELIGAGGFGFVLKVSRREDGFHLAVKLILKNRMARGGMVRCSGFAAAPGLEQWSDGTLVVPLEAYIMRKASHESVVGFVDLFGDENYFYLVSRLIAPVGNFPADYASSADHGAPWCSLEEAGRCRRPSSCSPAPYPSSHSADAFVPSPP